MTLLPTRAIRAAMLALCFAIPGWAAAATDCKTAPTYPLPQPSKVDQSAYQSYDQTLLAFLDCGNYLHLGWAHDKRVRDTGPYIGGKAYGTHPAVRIVYSPQVIEWMTKGRKGEIPDGAMIIKEQYSPPAARYEGMSEEELQAAFAKSGKDWTVMIKDSRGSKDGWYWSEVFVGMSPDAATSFKPPYSYPNGGFGHYCLNCHSSASNEHTFSALNNVERFSGDPLTFRVDNSWRKAPPADLATEALFEGHPLRAHEALQLIEHRKNAVPLLSSSGVAGAFPPLAAEAVRPMVGETFDRVVPGQHGPEMFLSSDQCMGCHDAVGGYAPTMFVPTGDKGGGINLSPFGEWRWSPMGLAGRDPIFYAQLESELAYIERVPDPKTREALRNTAVNTCFRCHGVMGKRQWDIDHKCVPTDPVNPCDPSKPGRPQFEPGFTDISDSADAHFKYGALARDGVSCLACHRQQETRQPPAGKENALKYFLEHSITGLFQTGARDRVAGPFKDDEISPEPMKNALGATPKHDDYMKSPRLCGSCHAINLPVIDKPPIEPVGPRTHFDMEQATYLEWLNSSYQTEIKPVVACGPLKDNPACARTCQDCHMPRNYIGESGGKAIVRDPIQTKFAVIEDQDYPQADHRLGLDKIRVRYREKDYARHELLGANVFLLEMFRQANELLGVRFSDFMTGTATGLDAAIANTVRQVRSDTVRLEAKVQSASAEHIVADVTVTNLTGHRFPSGVGFRRAFIELLVIDTSNGGNRIAWSSGRTNGAGVIVGMDGKPLPSESFEEYVDKDGRKRQHFQDHYETITSDGQVQIYEELTQDAEHRITTSFLRRDYEGLKDNRLLPRGWSRAGPDPKNFSGEFLEATFPKGRAADDPRYRDGSGTDSVRYDIALPPGLDPKNLRVQATLYYQSIPPYFLQMRFAEADGPATRRLRHLVSIVKTEGTPIENWKLEVARVGPLAVAP
jgi:hypothetical protein